MKSVKRAKQVEQSTQKQLLRLLIVEDSEDDSLLLVHELRRGGFAPEFLRVDNREDMEHALQSADWDIIITDHRLPQFSSEAAVETAKAFDQDIPVIVVSGSIGEEFAVRVMRSGAHDYVMKGNLTRLVPAIEREVTQARFKRKVRMQDNCDRLTGLANRKDFEARLDFALKQVKSCKYPHALLYIDLDQFKIVNDTCGHAAGDSLLIQLTAELKHTVRESDTLARLGGDEFGILIESCPLDKARAIADKILDQIKNFRFQVNNSVFSLGASIGLVMVSDQYESYEQVMSAADVACFTAKDLGRNRVHVYSKDDISLVKRHGEMRLVAEINNALDRNSFFISRQKIISTRSGRENWEAYEFLVRMRRDDGSTVMPIEFINAAERFNIMPAVDRWVIDNVFRYISELPEQERSDMYFINLSGNSLNEDSLYTYIREKLCQYQVPAHAICFEITETSAILNIDRAQMFIGEIKHEGFRFALDDFGAGISSYNYLRSLPIDYIKIDGSFIRDILTNEMSRTIVDSIIRIGHVAGVEMIAEFVENERIHEVLKTLNIDMLQGFGIHKPETINTRTNTVPG